MLATGGFIADVTAQVSVSSGDLFGREREVAALADAIATGREQGAVLLVTGEPGIGKSALLTKARSLGSEAGYAVLSAVGIEGEMHLPFGGVQQVVAPIMSGLPSLPRRQRAALGTALGLAHGPAPDLFLIAESTNSLLIHERRKRSVMILVDDAQWLDPQSHQILAFVAHRAAGSRVLVVGAVRSGHPGPLPDAGFPELLVEGVDDETAERILSRDHGPLSATEVRRIRREASGNPLALLELPRVWGAGPPSEDHPPALTARLEQAFAGRVAGLPETARDALLLAAVGSSNDCSEIGEALGAFGACPTSSDPFAPAVQAGLLTREGAIVGFRHPLVRSGVLQRESLSRRHAAHRAWADVLTSDKYRSTWHRAWSIVGPDDLVADDLAATAPDFLRRGAVMTAVDSLERAAQLTASSARRGKRLLEAAEQAFGVGRAEVVARILREAATVDLTEIDHARLVWLTEALNGDISANPALIRELCDNAARAVELGEQGLGLNLLLSASLRCWWADSGPDVRARVVAVLDSMTGAQDEPQHLAALSIVEPVLRGSEVMGRLQSVALDDVEDADALRIYAMAAYGVGDFVLATDLLDRSAASLRADGRLGLLPVVLALLLHMRLELGDWAGAAAAAREVNAVSMETGQSVFALNNVLVEGRSLALRGEWAAALDLVADAADEALRDGVSDRICLAYQVKGTALLSANRSGEAFDCLRLQYDPADAGYHLRESFATVALMAEAAVDCGRSDEARDIVANLEPVAIVTPSPLLRVNLLYAKAVLASGENREACFRAALANDLTRWPWPRARLQLEYGLWLAHLERRAEAVKQIGDAYRAFDRLGASRWSARAAYALTRLEDAGHTRSGRDDGTQS